VAPNAPAARRLAAAFLVLAIAATPGSAIADPALPSDLIGLVSFSKVRFPWSLTIDSLGADGAVEGRMDLYGVACHFDRLRVSGAHRDDSLLIRVPATGPRCAATTIELKQSKADAQVYEGTFAVEDGGETGRAQLGPPRLRPGPARPGGMHRIGLLWDGTPAQSRWATANLKAGLQELGYVEDRNLAIAQRWADGDSNRFPALARELVALEPDAIVVSTTPGTRAAAQATASVPIVMLNVLDAAGAGLVANLARPEGNITGLSGIGTAIGAKYFDLARAVVPGANRFAVLMTDNPVHRPMLGAIEEAARSAGISVRPIMDRSDAELHSAFAAIAEWDAGALIVLGGAPHNSQTRQIAAEAARLKLPTVCPGAIFAHHGCLLSYGSDDRPGDFAALARYVDRILRGTKPRDLPVERATVALIINLGTAKALGLTVPRPLMLRADRVLE
jgi:putative ABC transport system substrate-binding protein